ncbi:MAG TPA: hypothetical protein PLK81_04185, partial [Kiritimatiellia bacterium]|nr:hypothetical protein [Kiritimatiellia bacterium]
MGKSLSRFSGIFHGVENFAKNFPQRGKSGFFGLICVSLSDRKWNALGPSAGPFGVRRHVGA